MLGGWGPEMEVLEDLYPCNLAVEDICTPFGESAVFRKQYQSSPAAAQKLPI